MKCPECQCDDDRTIDVRSTPYGIRRRHKCLSCNHRWSTIEIMWGTFESLRKARGRRKPYARKPIPEHLKEEYRRLTRSKRIPAAKAREIMGLR